MYYLLDIGYSHYWIFAGNFSTSYAIQGFGLNQSPKACLLCTLDGSAMEVIRQTGDGKHECYWVIVKDFQ